MPSREINPSHKRKGQNLCNLQLGFRKWGQCAKQGSVSHATPMDEPRLRQRLFPGECCRHGHKVRGQRDDD
eukprot:2267114-Amphidinium_carterae.1